MDSFASFLDAHSIRFERLLPARIEVAWSYLTEADLVANWLAQAAVDLRDGGEIRLEFSNEPPGCCAEGDVVVGAIDQFNPPQHLTYSWNFTTTRLNKAHQTHVAFELEEFDKNADFTILTLTHTKIPTEERANFAAGWHARLEILMAHLKGEAPESFEEIFQAVSEGYRSLGFELAEEKY